MLLKISTFIIIGWLGLTAAAFACGVDTSAQSKHSKHSKETSKSGQLAPEGISLTSADKAKDDRWKKVKRRLKKARDAKASSK